MKKLMVLGLAVAIIPSFSKGAVRTRGADQSKKPRTIITSPTWSFYRQ